MIFFHLSRQVIFRLPSWPFCLNSSLFCIYFTLFLTPFLPLFSFSFPFLPFSVTFSPFFSSPFHIFSPKWHQLIFPPPPVGGYFPIYRPLSLNKYVTVNVWKPNRIVAVGCTSNSLIILTVHDVGVHDMGMCIAYMYSMSVHSMRVHDMESLFKINIHI
jgi:hypothetical protein